MEIERTKEGMALIARLNAEYSKRVEEEFLKKRIDYNDQRYSYWPKEKVNCYNEEIKRLIEEKVRDEIEEFG